MAIILAQFVSIWHHNFIIQDMQIIEIRFIVLWRNLWVYEIWMNVICADSIFMHMYKTNVTNALDLCKKYCKKLRSCDIFYFVLDSNFSSLFIHLSDFIEPNLANGYFYIDLTCILPEFLMRCDCSDLFWLFATMLYHLLFTRTDWRLWWPSGSSCCLSFVSHVRVDVYFCVSAWRDDRWEPGRLNSITVICNIQVILCICILISTFN